MKRAIGLGGIFFKCKDPEKTKDWYGKHLGIPVEPWGALFPWRRADQPEVSTYTAWSTFKEDTAYFEPSNNEFMINYQVEDLYALLETLKAEGVTVLDKTEDTEYGKFGWILDPEGRKIELWEPPK
jgi:catechol 2,3-dioxygenase-like lactoylglutathione lyase family enzyme